jgi:voltage-gated potassium channel
VALFVLLGIIVFGTVGFVVIEGYSWLDAFYMTIITVSTVGFGLVKPLTTLGKIFTSFLIIFSFGTFAFAVGSITQYLVSGEYKSYFKNYRVDREIDKLNDHIILCGYGRNGKQALETLRAYNESFVVIEQDEALCEKLRQNGDLVIQGNATREENITKAGITRAKALITTLPEDADNVFVVLTARDLNRKINIISRASQDNSDRKLRVAGANNVIMPDRVGGAHMAETVLCPDVIEFIDHISVQGPGTINLEEISFSHIPEEFQNRTIRELNAKYQTGVNIIGFKTPKGEYIINPDPGTEIVPDSKLFVLGQPSQISYLNKIFGVNIS